MSGLENHGQGNEKTGPEPAHQSIKRKAGSSQGVREVTIHEIL